MTMKARFNNQVSRDEMLQLREMGYSTKEIAEQLECCVATVRKYIGGDYTRKAPSKPSKAEPEKSAAPETPEFDVQISRETISILGMSVLIDYEERMCMVEKWPVEIDAELCIPFEKMADIARAITAVVYRAKQNGAAV